MTTRKRTTAGETLANALARRDLSVAEARARLVSTGAPAEEIERALADAMSRRWLDDRRLAENLVRKAFDRMVPFSLTAIGERLAQRMIAPEFQQEALAAIDPAELDRRLIAYARSQIGRTSLKTLQARLARVGHTPERVVEIFECLGLTGEADD